MKSIFTIMLLGLLSLNSYAQRTVEKEIDYNDQFISVDLKFADSIEVETWDKPYISFQAKISTKDGKHLDAYELEIEETGGRINITSKAEPLFEKFQEEKKREHGGEGDCSCNVDTDYKAIYTLFIPKNADFKVSSINGDLHSELIEGNFSADLINGNINIEKYTGELDLQTINGEIDLDMRNTSLVAETLFGNIFASDGMVLESEQKIVGQTIKGDFDNSENRLRLNTINGNIYLR